MATQFEIDCALMAGAAYASNRSTVNYFPAPTGWLDQLAERQALPSGFEAATFRRTNIKGVSIAFKFPKPCHVVHALN
jgi:hypothetical protein